MKSKHLTQPQPSPITAQPTEVHAHVDQYFREYAESAKITQHFSVSYRYPVYFTNHLFTPANRTLTDVVQPDGKRDAKLLIVAETPVLTHQPSLETSITRYLIAHNLNISGSVLQVPGGESIKQTPETVESVLDAIHTRGIDRHSYILAIGGGALLDAVGYAAAIAHRGIRLVRIPTTVLSQNDSGVGVKNAINAFGKKNFLGTFAPPYAVLNDLTFLDTLPLREWRSGIAEAVKVALIKDRAFFADLEQSAPKLIARDREAMRRLVMRCAQLHIDHIASGDPFEMGSARPLDFGHWAAHRLEYLSDYRLRHGEAVAIGIALDTTYSKCMGYLTAEDTQQVLLLLTQLGFDLWVPELSRHIDDSSHPRSILRGLEEFREHLGGYLTVTLLRGIGTSFEVHDMDLDVIRQSVQELESYANSRSNASLAV
jgi:3-dehydroquinate synthase